MGQTDSVTSVSPIFSFAHEGFWNMTQRSLSVALMSSQMHWGGGEQLLYSLGDSLQQLGHRILWVAPGASRLMGRVRAAGFEGLEIAGRHPSPVALLKMRKELQANEVSILHGNDTHAISWGTMLAMGQESMKLLGVKHTIFPITSATKYNWLVDKMVCVSRAVREVCLDGGILDKRLVVVSGGLEPPSLDRRAERQRACETLGIEIDTPLISAVGSLIPCKGFDTLIEAADALRQRIGNFRLVICGDGSMRHPLQQMIDDRQLKGHVSLLGFCENATSWIAASDLFVHPTRSEGLSLVAIAAQMVGTPMVASEVGGLREVIRCQYTSRPLGWIFATHDPNNLAELIENALSDQKRRLQVIHDAQQSALNHFTLDKMVQGFLRVYTDMARQSEQSSIQDHLRAA
jgi:glycosyltransferase involved in cell wall biosynthesis